MPKFKIAKFEPIEYVSKKTNNPVRGTRLHVTAVRDYNYFISEKSPIKLDGLKVGDEVLIDLGENGFVQGVYKLS